MIDHATQFLSEQEIKKAVAAGVDQDGAGNAKAKADSDAHRDLAIPH
jgi:hypothetical protein